MNLGNYKQGDLCVARNDYPFDRIIINLTKQGSISKSIVMTFERDVQAGGRDASSVAGTRRLSREAEIKIKDIAHLFMELEEA